MFKNIIPDKSMNIKIKILWKEFILINENKIKNNKTDKKNDVLSPVNKVEETKRIKKNKQK